MTGKTQVHVFKHSRRLRFTFAALSVATLAGAVFCAFMAVTADSETEFLIAMMVVPTGLFAILFSYVFLRLQVKIIVHDDYIRCTGLFRSKRIPFSEVIEFELDRYRLRIRSKKHRIRADPMIEDIRGLTDLVEKRLEEVGRIRTAAHGADAREQKIFCYARGFKWIVRLELVGLILIVALFFLMRPEEFQWGWVVCMTPFVAGIPVALYVLYRTITTVEFLDDFLCWQRGRRTVTIPYETIEQAVVKKTWNGFQYLDIHYKDKRSRLSGALVPFDRLIALLSDRAPVSWAGAFPLRFPVVMKGSSALEQLVGVIAGLLFGAVSLYLILDPSQRDWFSGIVLGLFSIGIVVSVTLLQGTYDSPRRMQVRRRKIIFGKRRFVVVDWCKCHTFRARDVTDVYFRIDNSFSTTYVLEISLGERRFVFQGFDRDVPLLPLYQLLCQAYHPEGYRDPLALSQAQETIDRT